jgi:hypothetical protein
LDSKCVACNGLRWGECAAAKPSLLLMLMLMLMLLMLMLLLLLLLLQVLEVKSLQVGALVRVQAECRIAVTRVTKVQPFVRGIVEAVADGPLQDRQLVQQQMEKLQTTMQVRLSA